MSHTSEEIIGAVRFAFDEVTSTNDVARNLYQSGIATHGALITAGFQTSGRGQEKTAWESAAGLNILCSVVLEPAFLPADKQVYLNIALCCAVREFIQQQIQEPVTIKWPNDMYLHNRKIAGLLIENGLQQSHIRYCIAGIGINVNQQQFSHPIATSMQTTDGRERELSVLYPALCASLNKYYGLLQNKQFERLMADYHANLLSMNAETAFIKEGITFTAVVKGIDEYGRLVTESDGVISFFNNKEVVWIL